MTTEMMNITSLDIIRRIIVIEKLDIEEMTAEIIIVEVIAGTIDLDIMIEEVIAAMILIQNKDLPNNIINKEKINIMMIIQMMMEKMDIIQDKIKIK